MKVTGGLVQNRPYFHFRPTDCYVGLQQVSD
jgi:hypothetical protein